MAKMGQYCKAYQLKDLRRFDRWEEDKEAARQEDGEDQPRVLSDDDVVYIQENLVVTDGIFIDENIIFDDVTDEWESFCRDELEFSIPEDVLAASAASDASADAEPATEASGGSEANTVN